MIPSEQPAEQPETPRWTDYLAAGRMPLWLATVFGLFGSMGATLALAGVDLGLIGGIPTMFIIFAVLPAVAVPVLARYKGRSLLRWGATALVVLMLSVYLAFLPLMAALTIAFAIRPPIKIPEATLEAEEAPGPMQTLVGIREDVATLHRRIEALYLSGDYRGIVDERENLEAIDPRVALVPAQVSERGGRVRLHTRAGAGQMLEITDAADYVATTIHGDPSLAWVAQDDEPSAKSKPEKALYKQVRQIEVLLDRSRIQIGVAKGLLDELGHEAPKQVARPWMPPQAILPPEALPGPGPMPGPAKRRPQRSPRRNRF